MKKIFRILASVSALAALVSCQQFQVDTQMTDEEYAQHIKIVCDAQESYTLAATEPQAVVFNVSSNASWTISGGAEWLSITPSSSSASGLIADVTVIAQSNEDLAERTASITISNDKYETQVYTVNFTQIRKGQLFVQPVYEKFDAEGSTLPFTVESNQDWWVRSSEAWLTLSKTSGEGAEGVISLKATAVANEGLERTATITVGTATDEQSFEVVQKGVSFSIVVPEDPTVDGVGGDIVVEMDATIDWTIKSSNDAFKAEKIDGKHFKVSVPFNSKFVERTTTITVESAIGKEELVLTQPCNFVCENCEVLEDGSVKLLDANKSRVYLKDELRYLDAVINVGDKSFGEKGQFWFSGKIGEVNFYNQITLGGNLRMRTDGYMKDGNSSYMNGKYTITQDELNAIKTYEIKVVPNADDSAKMDCSFIYNGTEKVKSTHPNPFACDPDNMHDIYFGFYETKGDGSWFIATSCEYSAIPE